jgi:type IV secretory pathway VirB10-like protein
MSAPLAGKCKLYYCNNASAAGREVRGFEPRSTILPPMSRFFLGAVVLALAAAGLWLWFDESGPDNEGKAIPPAVDQRGSSAGEILPPRAAPPIQAMPAREAPAPAAPAAAQAAALPASDPFRSFLEARLAASAPMPLVQQNQAAIRDAFKAALEESERRRAAESKSPFGEAKP